MKKKTLISLIYFLFSLVHAGRPGLQNLGNSCYFNSIMQCLASCQPLNAYLTDHVATSHDSALTTDYLELIKAIHGEPSTPSPLATLHTRVTTSAGWGLGQQDASEMLSYALVPKFGDLQNRDNSPTDLGKILGMGITSQVWHDAKVHVSNTTERTFPITVEIQGSSLEDCLDSFFTEEDLSGDNQLRCSVCNTKKDVKKQLLVADFSTIFCISLNRFAYDKRAGRFAKISTPIVLPPTLTIKQEWLTAETQAKLKSPGQSLPRYKLIALSIHGGGFHGGHYWAYARDWRDGNWYNLNDSASLRISESEVLKEKSAYILFYQLENTLEVTKTAPLLQGPLPRQAALAGEEELSSKKPQVQYTAPKTELEELQELYAIIPYPPRDLEFDDPWEKACWKNRTSFDWEYRANRQGLQFTEIGKKKYLAEQVIARDLATHPTKFLDFGQPVYKKMADDLHGDPLFKNLLLKLYGWSYTPLALRLSAISRGFANSNDLFGFEGKSLEQIKINLGIKIDEIDPALEQAKTDENLRARLNCYQRIPAGFFSASQKPKTSPEDLEKALENLRNSMEALKQKLSDFSTQLAILKAQLD